MTFKLKEISFCKIQIKRSSKSQPRVQIACKKLCSHNHPENKPLHCRYRAKKGIYTREDSSSKLMKSTCIEHHKKYFSVELNLSKQKWLVICNNNPNKTIKQGYFELLGKEMDSNDSESTRMIFC